MLSLCYLFATKYELYLISLQNYFFWNKFNALVIKNSYFSTMHSPVFEYTSLGIWKKNLNYCFNQNKLKKLTLSGDFYTSLFELLKLVVTPLSSFFLYFSKNIRKKEYFDTYISLIDSLTEPEESKFFLNFKDTWFFKKLIKLTFSLRLVLKFLFLNTLTLTIVDTFKKHFVAKMYSSIDWLFVKRRKHTFRTVEEHLVYYRTIIIRNLVIQRRLKIRLINWRKMKWSKKKVFFNKTKVSRFEKKKKKINSFFQDLINSNHMSNSFKNYNFYNLIAMFFNFFMPFFNFFKKCFISIAVGFSFIVFSFYCFKLPFLRTSAGWLLVALFGLWMFSGFNHFLKRYKYGKYTTAMQRFWKRAFMCFWMVEGFLFVIFFYYTLIASAEPRIFFDIMSFYVPHCIKPTKFLLNCFLIINLIIISTILLIILKYKTFRQIVPYIVLLTLILFYILLQESYQFYYLLNFYNDAFWIMDEESYSWTLEYEVPRARNRLHYTTLIIVAKFWHYIFIFLSWVFFVVKTLEQKRLRYAFFAMNIQNFIIFYIMNWVCMHAWLKWIFRRFMDQQYYWFFSSFRVSTINIIVSDFTSLTQNFIYFFVNNLFKFNTKTQYLFEFYFKHPLQNFSPIGAGLLLF